MARVKNREFWESAKYNKSAFLKYYNRLLELSISMFEWKNLPETVDARFLELALFGDGMAVFFKDNDIGYLALRTMIGGHLNVYQIPTMRTAYASNGYNAQLDMDNSVIIFNNMIHTNCVNEIETFARDLWELDRIININAKAQKTPCIVACDETQRLTMKNLYMKYEGNEPFIFADKSIRPDAIKVLRTDAPYIADKIYALKTQIWNEALTYLGISNVNIQKRARLLNDEVHRNMGAIVASRYSRLESRRQACEQINRMFGLDIWCDYREDYQIVDEEANDTYDGKDDSKNSGEDGEMNG